MFGFPKGLCPFGDMFVGWLVRVCKYFKWLVMTGDDLGVALRRQQTEFMCRHASVEKRVLMFC